MQNDSFEKNYYLWALKQVLKDYDSGYSFTRSLQLSITWRFFYTLETFPCPVRLSIWRSLVKRFHEKGAALAVDPINDYDMSNIGMYIQFLNASYATVLEPDIIGPRMKNRDLKKLVMPALENLLRSKFKKHGGGVSYCVSQHGKYILQTNLDSGSQHYQLCYWHILRDNTGAMIRENCSVLEWLGISSQSVWKDITEENSQQVVKTLISVVKLFKEFCEFEMSNDK